MSSRQGSGGADAPQKEGAKAAPPGKAVPVAPGTGGKRVEAGVAIGSAVTASATSASAAATPARARPDEAPDGDDEERFAPTAGPAIGALVGGIASRVQEALGIFGLHASEAQLGVDRAADAAGARHAEAAAALVSAFDDAVGRGHARLVEVFRDGFTQLAAAAREGRARLDDRSRRVADDLEGVAAGAIGQMLGELGGAGRGYARDGAATAIELARAVERLEHDLERACAEASHTLERQLEDAAHRLREGLGDRVAEVRLRAEAAAERIGAVTGATIGLPPVTEPRVDPGPALGALLSEARALGEPPPHGGRLGISVAVGAPTAPSPEVVMPAPDDDAWEGLDEAASRLQSTADSTTNLG